MSPVPASPTRPTRLARPDLSIERTHFAAGARLVAGVDEVGRGCLTSAVCAAAVVLAPHADPTALAWARDSKAIKSKVPGLAAEIRAGTFATAGLVAWGVGAASAREIDRLNIRRATILAMDRALRAAARCARAGGWLAPDESFGAVLVDGVPLPELPWAHEAHVKGDATSVAIAAASILAKATRDRLAARLAARHPAFACWAQDAGYGSPAHLAALAAHGPLRGHHRFSFRPVAEAAAAHGIVAP